MAYGSIKVDEVVNSNGTTVDMTALVSTEATTSVAGYMSSTDKTKLDGIEIETTGISTTIATVNTTTSGGGGSSISGGDCNLHGTDYQNGAFDLGATDTPTTAQNDFLSALNTAAQSASAGSPVQLTVEYDSGTSVVYQITGTTSLANYTYSSSSPSYFGDAEDLTSMTLGSPTTYNVTITSTSNPIFDTTSSVTIDGVEYDSGDWTVTGASASISGLSADPSLTAGDTIVQPANLYYDANGHTSVRVANYSDLGGFTSLNGSGEARYSFGTDGEFYAEDILVKDNISLGTGGNSNHDIDLMVSGNTSGIRVRQVDPGTAAVTQMARFKKEEQTLYFNDSEKFRTTNTGITVTGTVTETSDIRFKKDIEIIDSALNKLSQLNGVTFKWIENEAPSAGVIAQDVEKVLPMLVETSVNEETGEEIKSVTYSGLIGLLVESVKELKAEVEDLKSQVNG